MRVFLLPLALSRAPSSCPPFQLCILTRFEGHYGSDEVAPLLTRAFSSSVCSFVKILVIEIFSSVLGLFGLIIGLLVSSKALEFE